MYLTRYDFAGDSRDLMTRWHALVERWRDDVELEVALATDTGIAVLDACPDRAAMERWTASEEWTRGVLEAGLPMPTVTPLGEVHAVLARDGVVNAPTHA